MDIIIPQIKFKLSMDLYPMRPKPLSIHLNIVDDESTEHDCSISQIYPWLYLGNFASIIRKVNYMNRLHRRNVKHIINCAWEIDYHSLSPYPYTHYQIREQYDYDITQHFREAIFIIDLHRSNHEAVYFHCRAGVNRSPCIVIAYMMWHEKISLEEALNKLFANRPCINIQPYFLVQLQFFSEKLQQNQYQL